MVLQIINSRLNSIRLEFVWLFAVISMAIIPHIPRIPVWIPILFFSLAIWKIFFDIPRHRPRFLEHFARLLLAIFIVVGILISYGTLVGRDAGISLLILLSAMKFLETRNQRDYYITSYLGMFLILTNFLYTQSILMAVYMLLVVTIFVCTLIAYNDADNFLSSRERFAVAASMVLQSLPLMLILFVLFPRIPGPLWGLPQDAHAGLTGIDDVMEPGSISQLILSNEIAFRVEFEKEIPEQSFLYWRGPVLWQTDGVKWFQDAPRPYATEISVAGDPVNYTVTLEPTGQNWLYALEIPIQTPERSAFSHDLQIKTNRPIRLRRRYAMASYTDYRIIPNDEAELDYALQLPIGYHEKSIALGRSWRQQGLSDMQIVNTALRMFNEQEFYYTTTPPRLLNDTIDQFLFESRQGFCEHYAAAFTILMRAAGLPTRVITGYQGGTVNPFDGFLVVRQRDAHAWTEVRLKDRGWVRIDPTSAVSPMRIRLGIEYALPEGILEIPLGLQNIETVRNFWHRFRDSVDAVNNRWNQWVLSYDARQQLIFFNRIGLGKFDLSTIGITLVLTLLSVFTIVCLWLFRRQTKHKDTARELYDIFCHKLARLGIKRFASEGPIDFSVRVNNRRKDLAEEINIITKLYINVRYGSKTDDLKAFHNHIKKFKPVKIK